MANVSIRDLRNHGGDAVERAMQGEQITVTRSGKPVATLGPLSRDPKPLEVVRRNWAALPPLDPDRLRDDLDAVLDSSI